MKQMTRKEGQEENIDDKDMTGKQEIQDTDVKNMKAR